MTQAECGATPPRDASKTLTPRQELEKLYQRARNEHRAQEPLQRMMVYWAKKCAQAAELLKKIALFLVEELGLRCREVLPELIAAGRA